MPRARKSAPLPEPCGGADLRRHAWSGGPTAAFRRCFAASTFREDDSRNKYKFALTAGAGVEPPRAGVGGGCAGLTGGDSGLQRAFSTAQEPDDVRSIRG